jgi:PleD family two-component response regulator
VADSSCGVQGWAELLKRADDELLAAKREGRNRVLVAA